MKFPGRIITALPLCFFTVSLFAQAQGEVYRFDTTWKAHAYNAERTIGFSGGFNNPQFSMGDLNNDGKVDLVVFEKGSAQIRTFINYGVAGSPDYRYRPQYERNFPEKNGIRTVNSFLKLEHLNCDNIPDLVTRGMSGFTVYYGYYSNNELHFNYYKALYYSPLTANYENFDPTQFPTNGWRIKNTGWSRQTSGTNPSVTPQQGAGMARFNANGLPAGSTALLISKRFRISANLGKEAKLSFWIYRDDLSAQGDSLSVYINHDTTLNNAVYIDRVARCRTISQPDTKPANGWYQYTFPLPVSVVGDTLYLVFKGTSQGGNNIFLDNIYWITSPIYGDINAYVDPGGDIPGIADVDKDGDLDFFSYNISGGFINFYKNYQKEENLPCDSIHINLKDGCWGRTYQGFTMEQTLGVVCPASQPVIPPAKVTHTGNTLCFFDHDGDGDIDYLNGGVSYPYIQFLENGKADKNYVRDTIIAQDTAWQGNGHVYHTPQFPAAFYLDIDQDGQKDILISPSAESASENYRNIAWYRNTGTTLSPVFTYQKDTLLVDQSIDMGTGSFPMIYDYNKDGKPDIFIGGDGFFQPNGTLKARIAYYQNTSSGGNPSFTLQDNDFLGIDALNIRGAYPAAGDLDNDGLDDLVVGHANGTISFYKNTAATGNVQPQWQLTEMILKDAGNVNIDSARNAAPFIYDMNKDGKKDLVIGSQSGWLFYYKNTGGTNQLSLQHQTGKLGLVKADPWNTLSAYNIPYIGRIDNTGLDYLIIGSNSGRISRYTGFQNGNVTTPYQRIDTAYSNLNFNLGEYSGFRSAPAVADLDGDGKYEMVMGNILGGIKIYKQVLIVSSVDDVNGSSGGVKVYPNPANNIVYINWERSFAGSGDVNIAVFGVTGQKLIVRTIAAAEAAATLPVDGLTPGIYFCEVISGHRKHLTKLVIIK